MPDEYGSTLVSVIIPTHNRVEFLKRSLASVLRQTYGELEIIIVDDASMDGTQQYITTISDERIIYIRLQVNQGGAVARNTGILKAKGKYIGFLDDDDEWFPNKLEEQLKVFKRNGNIGAVYSGFIIKDAQTEKFIGQRKPKVMGNIYKSLLKGNIVGTTSSLVVRTEVLLQTGLFDVRLPSCQDWDLWLSLAKICNFGFVDKPLVLYSVHDKRISTDPNATLKGRLILLEKYWDDIAKEKGLLGEHYERIGTLYCQAGFRNKGREYILKSLKYKPYSIKGIVAYLASFLNAKQYEELMNWYRRYRYRRW